MKAWTNELWVYDLRTNSHLTLKENPLTQATLDDFVAVYNADNRKTGEVVFTAYTIEGVNRPVTFALNGGPGAASVYLNLGAIGVFFVVVAYAFRAAVTDRVLQTGLHLILGGAIGNLIDRFRLGYVVDFVDVFVKSHHWPAFNVADSAICIGIGLLFLDMRRKPESDEVTAAETAS